MFAKIIFCSAVSLAILAVILLSILSPVPYKDNASDSSTRPLLALSLYIQQPVTVHENVHSHSVLGGTSSEALTFDRTLTEGPESTSTVVGRAQGFIIPVEQFARSEFNMIYLTFSTPEYSGSLSIQVKELEYKKREELKVVGGTGSFAFARGIAVFAEGSNQRFSGFDDDALVYQVNLQLRFPSQL